MFLNDGNAKKIILLRGNRRKALKFLRGVLSFCSAVLLTFPIWIAVQSSLVEPTLALESTLSELLNIIRVLALFCFSFLFISFTYIPLFTGFNNLFVVKITAVLIALGFLSYILHELKIPGMSAIPFMFMIGVLIAWLCEMCLSISLVLNYSSWKSKGLYFTAFAYSILFMIGAYIFAIRPPEEANKTHVFFEVFCGIALFVASLEIARKAIRGAFGFEWIRAASNNLSTVGQVSFFRESLVSQTLEDLRFSEY